MSLNRQQLTDKIIAAMAKQTGEDELPDEARVFAADLASAIHDYVVAGDVTGVKVAEAGIELEQVGTGKVV